MQQEQQKHFVRTETAAHELKINRPLWFVGVDANIVIIVVIVLGVNAPLESEEV